MDRSGSSSWGHSSSSSTCLVILVGSTFYSAPCSSWGYSSSNCATAWAVSVLGSGWGYSSSLLKPVCLTVRRFAPTMRRGCSSSWGYSCSSSSFRYLMKPMCLAGLSWCEGSSDLLKNWFVSLKGTMSSTAARSCRARRMTSPTPAEISIGEAAATPTEEKLVGYHL